MAEICTDNQYFPDDILQLTNDEVFIDGGAYIGDTLGAFIANTGNKFDMVYSFELEENNYTKLSKYIEVLPAETRKRVAAYNIGLSDRNETLLISGTAYGAHVAHSDVWGLNYAKLDALDNIIGENARVTYIKMDIEGSELKAILGASKIIKRNRPKLAICVYHKIEDIFELPLLVHELCPDYKLYLRHHTAGESVHETVLYAVVDCGIKQPKQR